MESQSLKVVCLGDSITWGFPYGEQYSWVQMLNDARIGEFINQGINGNTTSDMLRRFDRSVVRYNPTHVIIMGGANDVFCRESFDRITLNLKTMAQMAQEKGIKVIFGTPTAVDEAEFERLLERIRNWIKDYAGKNEIQIIDFAGAFFDNDGNMRRELLMPDGGHPTKEGYQAIFAQINYRVFD
jgi:lysophospholipase L1-like esterase